MSRRRFTKEFKLAAVRRLEAGESGSALARELEVKREKLYDWLAQVERYGVEGAFPGAGRRPGSAARVEPGREAEARVAELERKVGRQAREIDFLSAALRRVEDLRRPSIVSGTGASLTKYGRQGKMSARDLCRLRGLARASLSRQAKPDSEHVGELRQAIVHAALDHPAYGTRRTTQQVRRQKLTVNRKRVQRVMREENRLRRCRRTIPQTTDSKHSLRCYENLTREVQPTGPNKLGGSDLSYVRLGNRFVYVAVVWDVFSRRVVGWAVGPNLKTELPLAARQQALRSRCPTPGWIHHSDQGSQYASAA